MNNVCRVCLSENVEEKISLDTIIDHRSVAELITYCSGIEISPNDDLPQFSCSSCIPLLVSACKTKEMCIDSDKTLKYQIKHGEILMSPPPPTNSAELLPMVEHETHHFEDDILGELESGEKDKKISKRKSLPTHNSSFSSSFPPTKYSCYLCKAEFTLRKEKFEHLETVHCDDDLKCKLCRHKSQTARGLDNHVQIHIFPELLSQQLLCHGCGKSYQKACDLRRHIKLAHGDKTKREINFCCDHCDFKTFSKMNIKRHLMTIHLGIRAFACKLCPDKKYTSKITLDQHMITKHNQETEFVCQCCKRKFPTMSFLRSHLKSTCSGAPGNSRERGDPNEYREALENDQYRCKLCGLVFNGKGKIAQHYAQRHKHSNACNLCPATFNSYSNLKKHIQILHNKVHKYSCSFCSRTFGQKNQLQSHVNTHTGDKPFKCKFDFCTFRSGDLSAISKHQKKCSNNPINN